MTEPKKGNSASLESIHSLQLQTARDVGELVGSYKGLSVRVDSIERHCMTISQGVHEQGQMLGLHQQRLASHSEELMHLGQEAAAQREGTGRIKLAVARGQGETAGKRRLVRQVGVVLGALVSGGGLGWLINVLIKG